MIFSSECDTNDYVSELTISILGTSANENSQIIKGLEEETKLHEKQLTLFRQTENKKIKDIKNLMSHVTQEFPSNYFIPLNIEQINHISESVYEIPWDKRKEELEKAEKEAEFSHKREKSNLRRKMNKRLKHIKEVEKSDIDRHEKELYLKKKEYSAKKLEMEKLNLEMKNSLDNKSVEKGFLCLKKIVLLQKELIKILKDQKIILNNSSAELSYIKEKTRSAEEVLLYDGNKLQYTHDLYLSLKSFNKHLKSSTL